MYRRFFLKISVSTTLLSLSACGQTQMIGGTKAPSSRLNIGTKDTPAYSTGGIEKSEVVVFSNARKFLTADLLNNFYAVAGTQTAWKSNRGWSVQAKVLFENIRSAWQHGLQSKAYLPKSFNLKLPEYSVDRDREFTAGAISYLSDLRFGRTKPQHEISTKKLLELRRKTDIQQQLELEIPKGYFYQTLKVAASKALKRRKEATPNFSAFEVSMEKLRIGSEPNLPDGNWVIVNIAGFDLQAFSNAKMDFGSKVIVGQEGRGSPVGPDKIRNLKFSPDWTAPRSIIKRDLFPKLIANPSEFNKFGMEVVLNGQVINDPTSINWSNIKVSQVAMRQKPGPDNVLGGVRFTLSNSDAIFLHDTPNKALYNKDERAVSSGCIRVQKAKELAMWLLEKDGQPTSETEVVSAMTSGEISYKKLHKSVHLEIVYFQAWVDHTGSLRLGRDIYKRDTVLASALKNQYA